MYLNGNSSFNKYNTQNNFYRNRTNENKIQLKHNNINTKNEQCLYNINNNDYKTNNNNIETNENSSDISFYNSSLKNQILSPDDEEDIYQYKINNNINKKEIMLKNNDDIDLNYIVKNNININNTNYINNNLNFVNNGNKKALILDLDETLVHSSFQPLQYNNQLIKPDIYFKIFFNGKYHEIFVYKRPFLNKFLKEMNKIFNIHVFTASIEKYAKPLLERLDKHNYIIKKYFRESCVYSEGKFIKDLSTLNINLHDIIIVDNNPISYKFNKKNGIPIKSFHYDKNDKELLNIMPLLNCLSKVDDVRKYIPYIIENDEINYNNVNILINTSNGNKKSLSLNKKSSFYKPPKKNNQKIRLDKIINYNTNEEIKVNIINNNHYPETINFREPSIYKKPKIPNNNKNEYCKNYALLNNMNDISKKSISKNKAKNNSICAINFNLDGNDVSMNKKENSKSKNKSNDKYNKSCNNFYLNANSKHSFVINREKRNEQIMIRNNLYSLNLDDEIFNNKQSNDSYNLINRFKQDKIKTKIPVSKKNDRKINLNKKINNSDSMKNIIINKKNCKIKNYLNRFNSAKNISSKYKDYESLENDFYTITPIIKINDDYNYFRKNNTIEALGKNNNSIRNRICYNNTNCTTALNTNNNVNLNIRNTINNEKKIINEKYITNSYNEKCILNNLKNLKKKGKNKNVLYLIHNNDNNFHNDNNGKKIINNTIHRLLTDRVDKCQTNLNDNDIFSNYSLKREKIEMDKNCYIKRKMKLKKSLLNNRRIIIKENEKSEYEDYYSNIKKYLPSTERHHFKNIDF